MIVLESLTHDNFESLLTRWMAERHIFHLLVLLPEAEEAKVPLVQELCRKAGIVVAGAIFPALLRDSQFCTSGALVLQLADAPPPLLLTGIADAAGPNQVATTLTQHIGQYLADDSEAALFCIFDALTPNIATHLDQWYLHLADRVNYFGVNAGNERFTPAPCLFDGDRFVHDALLVQLLPNHVGALLEHGYCAPQRVTTATTAQNNRVVQIDWRPALDVYRELLAAEYGVQVDRSNFYEHAVHFPFGILRADGEMLVRIPVALDDDGGIICVGEIPPHSLLTLLDARQHIHHAVPKLAAAIKAQGAMSANDALLFFYCAGRRLHAGSGAEKELMGLTAALGGVALVGALSLGEIGGSQMGGYPLFHNATLVACRWPD